MIEVRERGETSAEYRRRLGSVVVGPYGQWKMQVCDHTSPVRLAAIHCIDNPALTVTAAIGTSMLWIKPVPLVKLANFRECVAEDYRRRRAAEGKTALPEEVAEHFDILVLTPGLYFSMYIHNTSDSGHRFLDGVLIGEVLR